MQASKMRSTSSWSRLVAWNPSLKRSASGPIQNQANIEGREREFLKLLHITTLASVVAAKALLLADLIRVSLLGGPSGRGTPLCSSLLRFKYLLSLLLCNLLNLHQDTYLILDKALQAARMVPKGSFNSLAIALLNKSSKNIKHFVIG